MDMSKKRVVFSLIGLVVVIGIIYLVVAYQQSLKSIKEDIRPGLELAQIKYFHLTDDTAEVRLNVIIDNPTATGLSLDSIYYVVFIEDDELAGTAYRESVHVESSDSAHLSFPVTVYYEKLRSLLEKPKLQNKDSAEYKIHTTIYSETFADDQLELEADKQVALSEARIKHKD